MAYVMELIESEAVPTMAIRVVTHVANLPQEFARVYGSIVSYLAQKGEQPLGPAYAAYFNMDMEHLDVEIGFPVAREIAGEGEIRASRIPAGKRATTIHKGAYADVAVTYDALARWMGEKGLEPLGVAYEFYYNSPQDVPESELLTRVDFLVK